MYFWHGCASKLEFKTVIDAKTKTHDDHNRKYTTSVTAEVDRTTSGRQQNITLCSICWFNSGIPDLTSALCLPSQHTLWMKHSNALPSLNNHCRAAALHSRETAERGRLILNRACVLFNRTAQSFLWAPDILPSSFSKWRLGSGWNYSWRNWCHGAEREVRKNSKEQANNPNVKQEELRCYHFFLYNQIKHSCNDLLFPSQEKFQQTVQTGLD